MRNWKRLEKIAEGTTADPEYTPEAVSLRISEAVKNRNRNDIVDSTNRRHTRIMINGLDAQAAFHPELTRKQLQEIDDRANKARASRGLPPLYGGPIQMNRAKSSPNGEYSRAVLLENDPVPRVYLYDDEPPVSKLSADSLEYNGLKGRYGEVHPGTVEDAGSHEVRHAQNFGTWKGAPYRRDTGGPAWTYVADVPAEIIPPLYSAKVTAARLKDYPQNISELKRMLTTPEGRLKLFNMSDPDMRRLINQYDSAYGGKVVPAPGFSQQGEALNEYGTLASPYVGPADKIVPQDEQDVIMKRIEDNYDIAQTNGGRGVLKQASFKALEKIARTEMPTGTDWLDFLPDWGVKNYSLPGPTAKPGTFRDRMANKVVRMLNMPKNINTSTYWHIPQATRGDWQREQYDKQMKAEEQKYIDAWNRLSPAQKAQAVKARDLEIRRSIEQDEAARRKQAQDAPKQ